MCIDSTLETKLRPIAVKVISPTEAYCKCMAGAILIDVRPQAMRRFKQFNVPSVFYFDKGIDYQNLIAKNETIIVSDTCKTIDSRRWAEELMKAGYYDIYIIGGGFLEWERGDLPIFYDIKARLSGSCTCQLRYRG